MSWPYARKPPMIRTRGGCCTELVARYNSDLGLFNLVVGILALIGALGLSLLGLFLFYPSRRRNFPSSNLPMAIAVQTAPIPESVEQMYLDVVKKALTRALVARRFERHTVNPTHPLIRLVYAGARKFLSAKGLELVRIIASDPDDYLESGHEAANRVETAETMLGTRQLDNMQFCIVDILQRHVPGDLMEAGVWRAGMTIFMRAVLKAYGDRERRVWVADSFEGLPEPDAPFDSFGWKRGQMAVSLDEVKDNFARYGLLDDKVCFLKGFFGETLPGAPINELAILRVDADLYESTLDVLTHLYGRLSIGGYAIFDDYANLPDCRRAIEEYRDAHNITEEIREIDSRAIYWRKER